MLTGNIVLERVVDFFDPSVSKSQFAHPINASSDARSEANCARRVRRAETVRLEIVTAQVLPIVVGSHVVAMDLRLNYYPPTFGQGFLPGHTLLGR